MNKFDNKQTKVAIFQRWIAHRKTIGEAKSLAVKLNKARGFEAVGSRTSA